MKINGKLFHLEVRCVLESVILKLFRAFKYTFLIFWLYKTRWSQIAQILKKHFKCFWDSWFKDCLKHGVLKPFNVHKEYGSHLKFYCHWEVHLLLPLTCSIWICFSQKGTYWTIKHFRVHGFCKNTHPTERVMFMC